MVASDNTLLATLRSHGRVMPLPYIAWQYFASIGEPTCQDTPSASQPPLLKEGNVRN